MGFQPTLRTSRVPGVHRTAGLLVRTGQAASVPRFAGRSSLDANGWATGTRLSPRRSVTTPGDSKPGLRAMTRRNEHQETGEPARLPAMTGGGRPGSLRAMWSSWPTMESHRGLAAGYPSTATPSPSRHGYSSVMAGAAAHAFPPHATLGRDGPAGTGRRFAVRNPGARREQGMP